MLTKRFIIIFGCVLIPLFIILSIVIELENEEDTSQTMDIPPTKVVDLEPEIQNTIHTPQTALHTFKLQHELFKSAFPAPEFIYDESIVFSLDSSEKSTGYILSVQREDQSIHPIYHTDNQKIINSLVGIGDTIFWVEYPRQIQVDIPWEIKSMLLPDGVVKTFRTGISEDQILPPVLRVSDSTLSWIEKKIDNEIVISSLFSYDPLSEQLNEIATIPLDERDKNKREGVFLNIQRPLQDEMLVHQSVFSVSAGSQEHSKTYELVSYPYDQSTPTMIKEDAQDIVDFTANDEWIVLCETGKVTVIDRTSNKVKYEVPGPHLDMTLDSPFIMGNVLYFRYSTKQIFQLDLTTGNVDEVTESRSSTSKIFNSAGYLGFSYMKAVDPSDSGEAEFTIIENISP